MSRCASVAPACSSVLPDVQTLTPHTTTIMSTSPATGETFLVIGGCGFLGHNLTSALLSRGEKNVHILDTRPPPSELHLSGVQYHTGDITDVSNLTSILSRISPKAVFHTASPHPSVPQDILEKVNVKGTANVIEACKKTSVRKLIFTSSAAVVFDGHDLVFVDERMPYPAGQADFDRYADTKARAEALVLAANTPDDPKTGVPKEGLRTVSIRPAGIFGPNDRQSIPGWMDTFLSGNDKIVLGDGQNLFDWTYVDNISHAHLLASDKLETRGYDVRFLALDHLPRLDAVNSGQDRGVPTSENRPDVQGATDYARRLPSTLSKLQIEESLNQRPVVRNKYDQFFHHVHPNISSIGSPLPEHPLTQDFIPVAGEAFFITNGQPISFWDFPRGLWREISPAYRTNEKSNKPWHIPREWALRLGSLSEWYGWLTGKEVRLNRFRVTLATTTRYYNIEKARRVLGYQPLVDMQEGIKRGAQWWLSTDDGKAYTASQEGKFVTKAAR